MHHRHDAPGLAAPATPGPRQELIRNSDLSLTRISLECGFYDQAHFSRLFTRLEGVNPMSWRLIGE